MADTREEDATWDVKFREDAEMEFFQELALHETERWIQAVTRKKFEYPDDFRKSLSNGILLCELLNAIKPGSVKRINKLPTPLAGLDNINVFLNACQQHFGLTETQLFDPCDLEDLSQRAISETEYLKQEVDRRARNVSITIYWLGKAVVHSFNGPHLDFSAFSALINHHDKDIISNESFHHDSWEPTEQSNSYGLHDQNYGNCVNQSSFENRHARDSSYDSFGSNERGSESGLDDTDNMPVRSEMRRYPSTGSLYPSGSGFSTTTPIYSDDRQDSMYQSSPDLSQGSHGRSLSSDSMDGSYHGNHSRQSSGSADGHSRSNHATRRQSAASQDPLQFIKTSGATDLAKVAKTQIEMAREISKMRVKVNDKDSGDDWQSNLSSWKNRRKSQSRDMYARVEEIEASTGKDPRELEDGPKIKPYSEIKEASEKRKGLGKLTSFYPVEDDNLSISTKSTSSDKDADQNDDSVFVKEEAPTTNMAPTSRLKKSLEPEDVAPWAKDDDQIDSGDKIVKVQSKESNNVLNSEPVKMRSHGPSWKKDEDITKRYSMPINMEISVHKSKQLWERNVHDSPSKRLSDKKPVGISAAKSIDNIRKAFEQENSNTQDFSVQRRPSDFERPSKSLDLTSERISTPKALVPLSQRSSRLGKANAQIMGTSVRGSQPEFIEKTIKMTQKPNHLRGFGFAISGGSDQKQPITVHKVSLGGAADVCELQMNDEIVTINKLEVHHLTHSQAQAIIDKAVKTGQLELKIRRYMDDRAHGLDSSHSTDNDDAFNSDTVNSPNEAEILSEDRNSPFKRDKTKMHSDTSSPSFDSSLQEFNRSGSNDSSSIMDKLLAENRHETYKNELRQLDNQSKPQQRTWKRTESPVVAQEDVMQSDTAPSRTFSEPITFSALILKPKTMMPSKEDKEPESGGGSEEDSTSSMSVANDDSEGNSATLEEPITIQTVSRQKSAPVMECQTEGVSKSDTITEERSTIIRRNKPDFKNAKATESSKAEPLSLSSPLKQSSDMETMDSPPPPPPPKDEPPPLLRRISNEDTTDSAGFGPPAILKRWQKTSKLENKLSSESSFDQPVTKDSRYSFSFSLRSDDAVTKGSGGNKDDFVLEKTTKDFEATVSQQKPLEWKATSSFSTNAERKKIDEWNRQQETARQPSPTTPTVNDRKQDEEYLTAQERFERDQQRINQLYEEEKRKAAEEEKRKKEEEEKLLKSQMEQLMQRSTVPSLSSQMNGKPDQQQPMTFRLDSSQGRPLMIDPRNQPDNREESLPQYSFHVDLRGKQESDDLERERERIRKEEKLRVEEEKRQWEEEEKRRILQKEAELRAQEERIQRERERLQKQQEEMEREKAQLEAERNRENLSRIQSSNERSGPVPSRPHSIQLGAQHSSSSSGSPRSPPPALEPRHIGSSSPSRSSWSPPSVNPKPDTTAREKNRLTREDLLAMNRKATPLQDRPEGSETDKAQNEPVAREIPSKAQLHSLNVVPKPRFTQSAAWIKDNVDDSEIKRPGRVPLIKDRDYSNQNDHWLVQEAERRRLARHSDSKAPPPNRHSVQMASTGPVKPVSSIGVNRWRDDMVATNNRPTYQSGVSSESRFSSSQPLVAKSVMDRSPERDTQFSARPQSSNVSLSQTLPANFSFNASMPSSRRGKDPPVPPAKPTRAPNIDRSQSDQVMAVSGKQPCSNCGEELGFGAAMVVESLGLYFHVQCFRCCVCQTPLGNGSEGADVRVRANKLHCQNCYSNDQAGLKFSKV